MLRRLSLICALLAVAVCLGGCDLLGELTTLRPALSSRAQSSGSHPDVVSILLAFAGIEELKGGTNTRTGPGTTTVQDKLVTGPFSADLPRKVFIPVSKAPRAARSAGYVAVKKLSGTFVAQFDGTTDTNADKASLSGIGAISFKQAGLGTACVKIAADFTEGATKGVGTFSSTGGTGTAATIRVSGTFKDTILSLTQEKSEDKGKISARAKLGKPPKPAPAACKALTAQLP